MKIYWSALDFELRFKKDVNVNFIFIYWYFMEINYQLGMPEANILQHLNLIDWK